MNYTFAPFAKPLYVMLKPIGSVCNLRCKYCYYLDKKQYYPEEKRYIMSDELLELFIQQYIESQTMFDRWRIMIINFIRENSRFTQNEKTMSKPPGDK
ncbi:hypothetical protein FACS189455_4920 [Bacteroidia bacterium]|nr:hypothetical protein FACS189455_4920 [Bacteroidia bacterium]